MDDLARFDASSDEEDFIARVRAREAADGDDAAGAPRDEGVEKAGGGLRKDDGDERVDRRSTNASKLDSKREKKRKTKAERAKRRKIEKEQFASTRRDEDEDEAGEAAGDDAACEKVFHGTFNVEGVMIDDELVLVDKKSKAVYSST